MLVLILKTKSPDSKAVVLNFGCLLELLRELLQIQMSRPHITAIESAFLGTACRQQYFSKSAPEDFKKQLNLTQESCNLDLK